ncbi:protein max-like [Corticium candelabrum]|uniref:protein max-like n=1 Tax=Corticium candelabrum TaxID=121492 RepID=UPI002E25D2FA|nr:protein max-like [Corticium candelabrum]
MSDYEDDREVVDIVYDDDGTDRRAHHNALERKRRDHIKDSFVSLRDAIPEIAGEKASRGQVLNKATAYIETLRKKTQEHEKDIEALKKQNVVLEQQSEGNVILRDS